MAGVAGNVGLAKFVLDEVDARESSGVCWLRFRSLNSFIAHLAIAAGSLRTLPAASGAGRSLQYSSGADEPRMACEPVCYLVTRQSSNHKLLTMTV